MAEGSQYVVQMPLRFIIMNSINKIINSNNLDEKYETAEYIYNVFWPSLKDELDEAIKEALKKQNIKIRVFKPIDYVIYGTNKVQGMKQAQNNRLKEAWVKALVNAVITVMERHNLVETPYRPLQEEEL